MKYALLGKHYVRYVDLRETKAFLINDATGERYKKCDGNDHVASNLKFSNWSYCGNNVYECNHPKVLDTIKEIKQLNFIRSTKDSLEKRLKSLSYEDALEINSKLGLGVDVEL